MRRYSTEDCLALFDTSPGGQLEKGWADGVLCQRTKTTQAGPMVYCECYPIWNTARKVEAMSELQKERHREAQRKLNEKNARKKLVRKINANFGERDIAFTATYPVDGQPADEKQAYRDIRNFLRRIRAMRARQNLPELKYVYITEATESERYGRRYHHHVIMSGDGMDREAIEASWIQKHKGTCNTRRYQHQAKHWSGFALYLRADKRERGQHRAMRRRWCCSKNLVEPKVTVADKKISLRKAGRIAMAVEADAQAIFAKLYPDCELLDIECKTSPWVTGVYISAELRRKHQGGGVGGLESR